VNRSASLASESALLEYLDVSLSLKIDDSLGYSNYLDMMTLPPEPNCCCQSSDPGTNDEDFQWPFLIDAMISICQARSIQ
jgi:hypothetical protein